MALTLSVSSLPSPLAGLPVERLRIERTELYERVWATPLRTLAREFGISDVALKKHCRKLNVPTPGLGYWAKRAAGKVLRRTPLPPAKTNTPTFTEIVGVVQAEAKVVAPQEGPVWEQSQFEAAPAHRVHVANELDGAPRAVRHTRATMRQARPDERGIIRPYGADCLDIGVTRDSIDRALRIMHAFLSACAARDWTVTLSKDGNPSTSVTVRGESIAVRLVEQVRREERKLTNPPRRPHEYAPPPYPRNEYFPTGKLTFRIDEQYLAAPRSTWSDGERQRVEDCLNDVMVGLVAAAEAKRVQRERFEAAQRQREIEELERAERARQRELEERRFKQLLRDSDDWDLAVRLRAFADSAEARGKDMSPDSEDLALWVAWVRRHADALDPLESPDLGAHLTREPPPAWAFPADRSPQGFLR